MRWDLVNELLGECASRTFLEIGVGDGECASRVVADRKYGVDPSPLPRALKRYTELFLTTSDDFFASAKVPRVGVALVDGLHHADQVLRDALCCLEVAERVVLHDCNPRTELAQRVPRATKVWNGDCWKAVVALRALPDVRVCVIDADEGLGVCQAGRNASPLTMPPSLTWDGLVANRREWLNLVSEEEWRSTRARA